MQVLFASRPVARGYEPGMTTNGKGQISSLYNTNSGTYIVQPSLTSPFCMGHTHLADGTVFTAGGDTPGYGAYGSVTLIEGRNVLRTYKPSTGWVNLPVKLAGMHWCAKEFHFVVVHKIVCLRITSLFHFLNVWYRCVSITRTGWEVQKCPS